MINKEDRIQLIELRIHQAEQAITDVEFCIENGKLSMAVNRIYYGMFYAVLALAISNGFETSKHQQLIGWFNKQYIHTGIFPRNFSSIVKKAFEARMDADYQINQSYNSDEIGALFSDMKLFISEIKNHLSGD